MKKWVNKSVRWFYEYRYRQIQKAVNQPEPTQLYWLNTLLQTAKHTRWGKMHDFSSIRSPEDFAKHVSHTKLRKPTALYRPHDARREGRTLGWEKCDGSLNLRVPPAE
jgi:hypothetical protein